MVMTVAFIVLFHILLLFIWIIVYDFQPILTYTNDLKEYSKCFYPKSKTIR